MKFVTIFKIIFPICIRDYIDRIDYDYVYIKHAIFELLSVFFFNS